MTSSKDVAFAARNQAPLFKPGMSDLASQFLLYNNSYIYLLDDDYDYKHISPSHVFLSSPHLRLPAMSLSIP